MSVNRGDRVEAVYWTPSQWIDDNLTVPPGTQGTVDSIDGAGTIFVNWDNGSRLGLTTNDRYRKVNGDDYISDESSHRCPVCGTWCHSDES